MPIDLYYSPGSPPCQVVFLVAKALKVDLNKIILNFAKGEHMKPEFLKINPQHTVPTMKDNDFALWESRAIITYLHNKYAQNDNLYPKEPKKRAVVDQRLYFDATTLYPRVIEYIVPLFFGKELDDGVEKLQKIKDALQFLEAFLDGQEYAAGNDGLTLADFSIVVSVSYLLYMKIDISEFDNVNRWFARVKKVIPSYESINGAAALTKLFHYFDNKK